MTLWLCRSGTGQYSQGSRLALDSMPCPTIMAEGLGGGNRSQYWLNEDDILFPQACDMSKPPYAVPFMTDIAVIPWNGLTVISTFSGCGGSCLGYRMAGFKVLWANEFMPYAQHSYQANAAADSLLDGRDIRRVSAQDILAATHLQRGQLDLLDGSPPCQAFSMAGKRAKGWHKGSQYANGIRQQNETLFTDYIRLVDGLQPKVFVAENVSGLVKGVAKGFFKEIVRALKACGYCVECRLLDAQWLGVPQMRQRIILQGIRKDLGLQPVWPKPLPYRYSVREALPWGTGFNAHDVAPDLPCSTDTIASPDNDLYVPSRLGRRKFTIAELKRICAFPDDFVLVGSYAEQWTCLGNSVPPVMMMHVAQGIRDHVLDKTR